MKTYSRSAHCVPVHKTPEGKVVSVYVEMTIDLDALARRLGKRAARNMSQMASTNYGAVKLKVVEE